MATKHTLRISTFHGPAIEGHVILCDVDDVTFMYSPLNDAFFPLKDASFFDMENSFLIDTLEGGNWVPLGDENIHQVFRHVFNYRSFYTF